MISVLIATRNRPDKLKECVSSILNNNFKDFEIIVVDQSDIKNRVKLTDQKKQVKLKCFRMTENGKSKALNLAFIKSKGRILAFTDDDCIVAKNWLAEIDKSYKAYPKIGGVFGNIYPYKTSQKTGKVCPATMVTKKNKIHTDSSTVHYSEIGIGNNMSIKRSVLENIGLFNDKLSPGTFGLGGGEDSEIIFRMLKNNIQLLTNPKIIIYHNRWLTGKEEVNLQSKYTAGLVAFQSYIYFSGYKDEASILFKSRVNERLSGPFRGMLSRLRLVLRDLYCLILQLYGFIKGVIIGFYIYAFKNHDA